MRISNKFIFTGIAVILVFIAIYQWIKSSSPIEIQKENLESFEIKGSYFEGDWQSEKIKTLFESADSIARNYGGISSAIYYNDPNEEDGLMKAFIGVAKCNTDTEFFEESREIAKGSYYKGKITNNYFQIPQRVYLEIEERAKEENLKIGEFSLEQYFSDTLMIVFIPIIEK